MIICAVLAALTRRSAPTLPTRTLDRFAAGAQIITGGAERIPAIPNPSMLADAERAPAASTKDEVPDYHLPLGMWYYHRDSDGLEWGPFTPGQLTQLLNLGLLDARSLIRSDTDETWHSYYRKPQPEDWLAPVEEDFDSKLAEGERIVADLRRHNERRRNGTELPWEDVDACRRDRRLQQKHAVAEGKDHYLPDANRCPRCRTLADALTWIYFSSPKETWPALCGCAGWLVVCDSCRIQVDFFIEVVS